MVAGEMVCRFMFVSAWNSEMYERSKVQTLSSGFFEMLTKKLCRCDFIRLFWSDKLMVEHTRTVHLLDEALEQACECK